MANQCYALVVESCSMTAESEGMITKPVTAQIICLYNCKIIQLTADDWSVNHLMIVELKVMVTGSLMGCVLYMK